MKKQKKWTKFRHRIIRNIAFFIIAPFAKIRYGADIVPFRESKKRQYLILYNHQTVFDQFFVGISVRGPIYYLATEDIFSNGFISSLLRYAVAPIPIKKQTTDMRAVMNCIKVAKEGGTIALAPEGNRTYSGKTEYINPAIASLAKKLSLPILLYRIEGGYGVQPRWSDCIRRGKMKAYVSQVIEPEDYKDLSTEELLEIIKNGLYINEASVSGNFYSRKNAEYLERVIYVCPECGISEFESYGDTLKCKNCSLTAKYLPTKEFEGVPFKFVNDWYEYQNEFVSALKLSEYEREPLYTDFVNVYKVTVYKSKALISENTRVTIYGNRLKIGEKVYNFTDISAVSVLGRNKLNVYIGDGLYQFKGAKGWCALKYVNIFYAYKNILKGEQDVKFLGL